MARTKIRHDIIDVGDNLDRQSSIHTINTVNASIHGDSIGIDDGGVGTPTIKEYIDLSISTSLGFIFNVKVATTSHINLYGIQIIDSVALNDGDIVLVWKQFNQADNGIYVVSTSSWARLNTFSNQDNIKHGVRIYVTSGALLGGSEFVLITEGITVVGADPIIFDKVNDTNLNDILVYDTNGPGAHGLLGPLSIDPRNIRSVVLIPYGGPVQHFGIDYGLGYLLNNNGVTSVPINRWYITLSSLTSILASLGGTSQFSVDSVGASVGIGFNLSHGDIFSSFYDF